MDASLNGRRRRAGLPGRLGGISSLSRLGRVLPLARALVYAAAVWLAIQALVFALVSAAPGGPAAALAGDFATRETQAAVSASFALDEPAPRRFIAFVARMVQGDLGVSYHFRQPVRTLIAERLLPTLALVGTALVFSLAAGTALGLWSAARPQRRAWVLAAGVAAHALPVFWVGQILMLGLGFELGWFPVAGAGSARGAGTGWPALADMLWHAVLPVATLVVQQMGLFVAVVHAKARQELARGYVRAAHARGITSGRVLWGHVARNVWPQLATVAANRAGLIFTGAVLVETLFAWPGIGRLLAVAILNRDHPVLLGVFALVVAMVIAGSVLADVLLARLDPRQREEALAR